MKKYRFQITIGILFLLAGMLLGSDFVIRSVSASNATPQTIVVEASEKAPETLGMPIHVSVSSVSLSIDIKPGYYDQATKSWTLGDNDAYFASMTSLPNAKSGNTYIYGHNTPAVFNKLNDTKTGDTAIVSTSTNKTFTYRLKEIRDLDPSDTSWILEETASPMLTLQTCAGFWDQYRRIFVFDFVSEA